MPLSSAAGITEYEYTYDEFVAFIRECLETGLAMPYVIED